FWSRTRASERGITRRYRSAGVWTLREAPSPSPLPIPLPIPIPTRKRTRKRNRTRIGLGSGSLKSGGPSRRAMFPGMGGRGVDPKRLQAMMRQMGIKMEDIEDVEEVVIRTKDKEYVF